ncbi:hypothetical protein [Tardiphaga sp.]|jgi:hypothetical protein|uniref:hypothetical protein n=1 Tax=Tardiphaga sp. TaxID=1926292 RepID=UPI0037D9F51F
MAVYPEFPRGLLREQSHSWNIVGNTMSAGQAGDGFSPVVRSDGGGLWSCVMSAVSLSGIKGAKLRHKDRIKQSTLLWRAVRQICNGGIGRIVVPRNDALFRPLPEGASAYGAIPHSDGALFSDQTGYYQSVIDVVTYGNATLRSTTLYLHLTRCGDLLGGESFSINHPIWGWRMYEIATVEPVDEFNVAVTFNPPLREAVPAGTKVEFDRPRCLMQLKAPNSMDLTVLPWTFNSANAEFIEARW